MTERLSTVVVNSRRRTLELLDHIIGTGDALSKNLGRPLSVALAKRSLSMILLDSFFFFLISCCLSVSVYAVVRFFVAEVACACVCSVANYCYCGSW